MGILWERSEDEIRQLQSDGLLDADLCLKITGAKSKSALISSLKEHFLITDQYLRLFSYYFFYVDDFMMERNERRAVREILKLGCVTFPSEYEKAVIDNTKEDDNEYNARYTLRKLVQKEVVMQLKVNNNDVLVILHPRIYQEVKENGMEA